MDIIYNFPNFNYHLELTKSLSEYHIQHAYRSYFTCLSITIVNYLNSTGFMIRPRNLTLKNIFPKQRIPACLGTSGYFSTVTKVQEHDPQYDYILSRNILNSKFSSSWISIQDSLHYNRGIYATAWLPAGTVVLEEMPTASILKKTGLKDPYDFYCPQCFMPHMNSSDIPNNHLYCSESCAQESMMIHQIREYRHALESFESQLRYYPILAISLIFEILKQFKSMSHSPLYKSLNLLSYIKHSEIPEIWKEDYSQIKRLFLKDESRQRYFSLEWYTRVMSIFDLNAFGVTPLDHEAQTTLKPIGSAFYLAASFFNHSCIPSALVSFSGNRISIILCQDVAKGEQIFISYLNPDAFSTKKELNEFIKRKYGFDCNCPRCLSPH